VTTGIPRTRKGLAYVVRDSGLVASPYTGTSTAQQGASGATPPTLSAVTTPPTPPWRDAEAVAAAQVWMAAAARRSGSPLTGPILEAHTRPWSRVYRAASVRGPLYLKLSGPSQAHEAALTALLAPLAGDIIPEVLAVDAERGWLLLGDAGGPLSEALAGQALLDAWLALLPRYAVLQRAFLGRVDDVLACGVPDHRLDHLAASLAAIVDETTILASLANDSLAMGPAELRAFLPRLGSLCEELAALGIGPTLQHDDLHDGNVFTGSHGQVVVLDWGDACVTHPFLSLWTVQRAAADRLGNDAALDRLRDAYLEPWAGFAPMSSLRAGARIGAHVGGVTRALGWYRTATLNPDAMP